MAGGKKLLLYMYYLTAVRLQKFQRVFLFLANDFYCCHSLMNEKKTIKFVYRECFEETLLTNNNITS